MVIMTPTRIINHFSFSRFISYIILYYIILYYIILYYIILSGPKSIFRASIEIKEKRRKNRGLKGDEVFGPKDPSQKDFTL
jgi:hypothetical protein